MPVDIADVRSIVEGQDDWRGKHTINLIASENVQSPAVRQIPDVDTTGVVPDLTRRSNRPAHPRVQVPITIWQGGTADIAKEIAGGRAE